MVYKNILKRSSEPAIHQFLPVILGDERVTIPLPSFTLTV
jgi:hypothetical protein